MWRILCLVLFLTSSVGLSFNAYSEGEEPEVVEVDNAEKSIYIQIKPAFVVNYGGAGKLKYIKADISLRMSSIDAANAVHHHMPYIRNNLVMLFSSQSEENISSQEGKEALRGEALDAVRGVLLAEDGDQGVTDLYFNNFLIQK